MRTTLYVISDLHLGGKPGTDGRPGFQICPPKTHGRLARFINGLSGRAGRDDVRLIIAGDIVDFLAEEQFEAFTADPAAARAKLKHILDSTEPVWTALRDFVTRRDGALTLMLGNHDIELSLPGVRPQLLDRIGQGRVEFLYDNEALPTSNAIPLSAGDVRSRHSRKLNWRT